MSEESTTPPEDANEPKKMQRFGKPDLRPEPSADFWDLESEDERAMDLSDRPREALPVPFAKGETTGDDDESGRQILPRGVAKPGGFVQTNIAREFQQEMPEPVSSKARMPRGFDGLDGEEPEPEPEPEVEPEVEVAAESPADQAWTEAMPVVPRGGTAEDRRSPDVTRGIIAADVEKHSPGEPQDPEKRKPLEARLQAEPAPKEDGNEGFEQRKPAADAGQASGSGPREISAGDLLEWLRKLSLVEKGFMGVLLLLLAGFACVIFLPAIYDLPEEKQRIQAKDFPQQGEFVTVKSATTYWREPVLDGPDADVVRRETVHIPVIEMEVSGNAAIRVLFRNGDGESVGDPVTRPVAGETRIAMAGTAGFDAHGMYAAYRTGRVGLWTVEVYEATSMGSDDFKLIFEMDLSAQLK